MKRSVTHVFAFALLIIAAAALAALGQQNTIQIHARRFEFTPSEVTVKKGQAVTLSLVSDDVPHSLLIEGLGVNAAIVKGHPTMVQIAPEKAGDFSGRCGRFCGEGHGRMKFIVHVTE